MQPLPIHPQPLHGEILSSWMIRLSLSNRIPAHTFYHNILNYPQPIWTRDIDRSCSGDLYNLLSKASTVSDVTIRKMSLPSYSGILSGVFPLDRHCNWILETGINHRVRKNHAMQFCKKCFLEDDIPYFRKKWRLSFYTTCKRHLCSLVDECPGCYQPIMFHRLAMSKKNIVNNYSLTICPSCKCDYRSMEIPKYENIISDGFSQIYKLIIDSLDNERLTSLLNINHPLLLFNGLRDLTFLLSRVTLTKLRDQIIEDFKLPKTVAEFSFGIPFEALRLQDRHKIIQLLTCLITDWPTYFLDACKTSNVTRSQFGDRQKELPFWIHQISSTQLNRKKYYPAPEELENMGKYFSATTNKSLRKKKIDSFGYSQRLSFQIIKQSKKNK